MLKFIITEDRLFPIFAGISLNYMRRKEDAIKDYTKAIEINSQDAQSLL